METKNYFIIGFSRKSIMRIPSVIPFIPEAINPEPYTPNPKPSIDPETLNSESLNPEPEALNPKP